MINVTKPFLPPLPEYENYLRDIWDRNWLTNNGPLVNELELRLKKYLKTDYLLFVSNGTIALQLAMKALKLTGEIVTTPFSFIATTSSIVWEGLTPVFADIDKNTLCIDPNEIEKVITDKTSAILATHVFGNVCDIDAIQKIADKYNLKVIYDAAHGFGTKYKNESIFNYGDISTASFHATKLYHTTEGGGIFTKDPDLLKELAYMRNFGFSGPETFENVGINGKNSEFHAAMGLCNLNYIDDILIKRKEQYEKYDKWLKGIKDSDLKISKETKFNYSYYPFISKDEDMVLKIIKVLNDHNIFPRRYFYPTLSELDYVTKKETPIANDISKRIICLPMYHDLREETIDMICRLILRTIKY